jgi:putative flippase GtrA
MTPRTLGLFIVVGSIGFMLDAGTTEGLVAGGLHPLVARVAAVAIAVPATFLLNRRFTFPSRAKGQDRLMEFGRYIVANGAALGVNYGVFALILAIAPATRPALAVAVGSLVAMIVSLVGYGRFVFRRGR